MSTFYYMYALEFFFIMKYHKNLLTIFKLSAKDFDKIYGINRKSNCTLSEYFTAVACMNLCGGMVAATPSPYSPQFPAPNNTKPSANLAEQYHSLYRDFKHASQVELRDKMTSKERFELNEAVEERFRQIIYPFTRSVYSVFTKLVDDFLKLFGEMVNGLILLKETGITLEDICSVDEHSQTYYSLQTTLTMRMDSKLSSCQPYNVTELEKLLEHELKSQLENSLRNKSNVGEENSQQFHRNDSQSCQHEETTDDNPYLTFLTEINCHMLHSSDTTEFDPILVSEKKMYLRNCLKLLRENEYFYVHSQSSSDSVNWPQVSAQINAAQTQTSDKELYNMSRRIYNQTVCHVQAAILAIFRSMKYGEQEKDRLFSQTTEKTDFDRIDESKNLIKKTLSQYMNPNRDNSFDFQITPSIKYEDEIFRIRPLKPQLNNEPLKTIYIKNEPEEKGFIREVTQQHPDLGNSVDGRYNTSKEEVLKVPTQKTQKCALDKVKEKVAINGLLDEAHVSPTCNLGNILFKGKKRDVRFMCTMNYMKPEVSHIEAIKFLKHMEEIGAALHRSYCSENPFLTKVEGPSFYFTVACADCRQELAPPQKLEAFKSIAKKANRSKFMAYILRKSHDTIYFPVKCGSCGLFLCDPKEDKKHLLRVPFHSPEKGFSICISRLKTHKCQADTFETDYRGCITDSMSTTTRTHCGQKSYENSSRRGHFHELLISPKRNFFVRSTSVPAFIVDKNENCGYMSGMARNTQMLKFEDAVTNILNIWTYEMINYEKGANSPHSRAQILNYRKSLSVFIKEDVIEKIYQRYSLPVSKPLITHANISGQAIKRSRSCHSKVRYETSASYRSESLIHDRLPQINTFQYALTELEDDAESFHYKNAESASFEFEKGYNVRSESLEHNNNTISISNNLQKRKERPYLQSVITQPKNIYRPHSLHSELKEKSISIYPRRSSSFDTQIIHTNEFSKQINAWQKELRDLHKSIGSPNPKSDYLHRKNMARPLSLDIEQLKHVTPNTNSRRSISFGNDAAVTDGFSSHIHAWKNELKELQKSVGSPHEFAHRNNLPRQRQLPLLSEVGIKSTDSHRRRRSSASFATETSRDLSSEISQWKHEMLKHPKSNLIQPKFVHRHNIARPRPHSLHSDLTPETPASHRRRRSSISFATETSRDLSSEISQWKREMKIHPKSNLSPPKFVHRHNIARPRPHSLHSDLTPEIPASHHRHHNRVSFATDTSRDLSSEISQWKCEMQQNTKSNLIPPKFVHRHNKARPRPHSMYSDLTPETPATHRRRRSCSFATGSYTKEDLLTQVNQWKNELIALQKSVQTPSDVVTPKISIRTTWLSAHNPTAKSVDIDEIGMKKNVLHFRDNNDSEAVDRKTITKANSLQTEPKETATRTYRRRYKSDSEYQADQFSSKIKAKDELVHVKKSASGPNVGIVIPNCINHSNPRRIDSTAFSRRHPDAITEDFSAELSAWEQELLELQKNVESPHIKPDILIRRNKARSISLHSEPKADTTISYRNYAKDDVLDEIKTWNHTLRELEINASSPHMKSETRNYKIKTRAVSLHAETKPISSSSNRPKSESVLDFSMELNRWKHTLQTLEENAKSPQSVTSTSIDMVKSGSLKLEPKYKTPAHESTDKFETHIEPIKDTWIDTPGSATSHESAYITQHKPSGRRFSATPRQLPAVPMPTTTNRRHSHYETTWNFIPLLHDKRATRLSTNPQKSTNSTVSLSNQARKSSIKPVIEPPDDSF